MKGTKTLAEVIRLSAKVFAGKVKKTVILNEPGEALFNPGAFRGPDGRTYLYARFSTEIRKWL